MRDQIIQRIQAIGGSINSNPDQPLLEFVQAITFPGPIYRVDDDLYSYGVYGFYQSNKELYASSREAFLDKLIEAHFSIEDETPRSQGFWRGRHFTPLTPDTPDYREWLYDFDESAGRIDLSPIRAIAGDGVLEFVELAYCYGYPDHYYICLQDPEPNNPSVFGTDHEEYFSDLQATGSLLDFFQNVFTQAEFREAAANYLIDQVK